MNEVTIKDVYPLSRIEDALSRLDGSQYFFILDMQSGYWQVEVKPEDRPKTAFVTADGLYQFRVMRFGLTNAPGTFQRMMDVLLAGLKWNVCLVYLDDIVTFSKTVDEHLVRLESVLKCLQTANLTLKLSKCQFLASTSVGVCSDISPIPIPTSTSTSTFSNPNLGSKSAEISWIVWILPSLCEGCCPCGETFDSAD